MHRVVVTRRIFPFLIDALRATFTVVDNQADDAWSRAQVLANFADAAGALLVGGERIDAELLAQCPRLQVVSNVAVGYNNLDLAACTAAGVVATNTPDVLNEATADQAWALLLAAARRLGEAERWLRAGQWQRWRFDTLLGVDLHGATLGLLGMGRIGRAIARRAHGFAMKVQYHNRSRLPAEQEGGTRWVSKDELLSGSDFVVIVVPYSAATHHLIGAAELVLMKPAAILVNIARGGVVDDAALIAALRAGTIAAAGLDVFENEPQLDPGFLALENVVLSPHIASATRATREAMARLAIRNLTDTLAGTRPPSLLNADVWQTRRR
jgi:lactate dehydrogenase-like 2-hydroxyacid dehydrogenase